MTSRLAGSTVRMSLTIGEAGVGAGAGAALQARPAASGKRNRARNFIAPAYPGEWIAARFERPASWDRVTARSHNEAWRTIERPDPGPVVASARIRAYQCHQTSKREVLCASRKNRPTRIGTAWSIPPQISFANEALTA